MGRPAYYPPGEPAADQYPHLHLHPDGHFDPHIHQYPHLHAYCDAYFHTYIDPHRHADAYVNTLNKVRYNDYVWKCVQFYASVPQVTEV